MFLSYVLLQKPNFKSHSSRFEVWLTYKNVTEVLLLKLVLWNLLIDPAGRRPTAVTCLSQESIKSHYFTVLVFSFLHHTVN